MIVDIYFYCNAIIIFHLQQYPVVNFIWSSYRDSCIIEAVVAKFLR